MAADLINIVEKVDHEKFIPVDSWRPKPEEMIFTEVKGAIIAPIHSFYGLDPQNSINYFVMTPKKCYNGNSKTKEDGTRSIGFREHCVLYLNYFERYYDRDHYLLGVYAKIKYCIDCYGDQYSEDNFMMDINRYLIMDEANPLLHYAIHQMNRDNYIEMTSKYRNLKNPCLEYSDEHAMLLIEASLIEDMLIPLVSHFMFVKRSNSIEVKRILLRAFDMVFVMIKARYGVDLIAKLYETVMNSVNKDAKHNNQLWEMQYIRAINPTVHIENTVESLIMQIIPKYIYSQSIVCFNYNAIVKEIKYKITDIPYEYDLVPVSSSNRDEDNNSEADKFESHMVKQNEALSMQIKVNCLKEMEKIELLYGPFTEPEINFYMKRLVRDDKKHIKNEFQLQLVSYLFMNEFGDTSSIKFVNNRQYTILMIAAKRMLQRNGLFLLADIISSKVEKIVARKTVNARIKLRMKMSETYPKVLDKYRNESILEDTLFGFIAKTLASNFTRIDYYNADMDGTDIICTPEIVCEEFLQYALMI